MDDSVRVPQQGAALVRQGGVRVLPGTRVWNVCIERQDARHGARCRPLRGDQLGGVLPQHQGKRRENGGPGVNQVLCKE